MEKLEKAKQAYDNIVIPEELSERVMKEISRAEKKRIAKKKKARVIAVRRWSSAAAVLLGVFILGLNTNRSFAQEMGNVPLFGGLAKVLTFRTYEAETEDYIIQVDIPTIEMISEDFADVEASVNEQILALCEQYVESAKEDAKEYREAFLATGGTLEEWLEHDVRIKVWYEVKEQTEKYLSLVIKGAESWNSAKNASQTFNIDLQTGKQVSFEEMTGQVYYEDNFAVEAEAVAAYCEKIQKAVAEKDLEKLADLTGFPMYVGSGENGGLVKTREEFFVIGADKIFSEELMTAVVSADLSELEPSMAGFVVGSGSVGIIFGVRDGQLQISGINY